MADILKYAAINMFVVNCIMHLLAFVTKYYPQTLRNFYNYLYDDYGLKLINEWNRNIDRCTAFKVFSYLLHISIILISFHLSFGYCAVYKDLQICWLIMVGISIIFDIIFFEILVILITYIIIKFMDLFNVGIVLFLIIDVIRRNRSLN